MRKQLTKRDFDVPKYYCLVWGGGAGGGVKAVQNTVQLNYINVSLTSPLHISRGRFYVRNLMRFSNL